MKSILRSMKAGGANTLILPMVLAAGLLIAQQANAQEAFAAACDKVDTFFTNFQFILKVVSAGIVTIAIVFAGYQIAFAHKRISDVAPILIGGLLIGGAATIASWFVDGFGEDGCGAGGAQTGSLIVPNQIASLLPSFVTLSAESA